MRALGLTQRPAPGTLPDAVQMLEIERPVPRPQDVLIQVRASSINIDDIHMAEGTFYGGLPISPRPRPDKPVIPGVDVAGTVIATGRSVQTVQIGDAVFGMHIPFRRSGAWSEFCAVDERWVTKKPEKISFETAAACGVSGLVALSGVKALRLARGMRILIVGVTGGIGAIAVQMAKRIGADVIGVCGSNNVDRAYQLGCSLVLDYRKEPWDKSLQSRGITPDGVLDLVGGSDTERMGQQVLKRDGIFATVVGPERFVGDRPLGWTGVLATLARVGYRMVSSQIRGPRYVLTGPGLGSGKDLPEVASAISAGILPVIDSTVPFELQPMREALIKAKAHRNNGRIVVQIAREP